MPGRPAFSVSEAIRVGWKTAWAHLGYFISAMMVAGIPLLVLMALQIPVSLELMVRPNLFLHVANFVLSLVSNIVMLILQMGMMYVTLEILRGKRPTVRDVFSCWRYTLPCIGATIVYGFLCLAGYLLLLVPGIILSLGMFFYSILVFDREDGPLEALKESWEMTRGYKWKLFVLLLALGLINLLGALPLLLGWTITFPLSIVAVAYAYEQLSGNGRSPEALEAPASSPGLPGMQPPPPITPG
ncbi:MAG: hypothetical protein AB1921_18325 [Thermodesulfobacteriota bacterium]